MGLILYPIAVCIEYSDKINFESTLSYFKTIGRLTLYRILFSYLYKMSEKLMHQIWIIIHFGDPLLKSKTTYLNDITQLPSQMVNIRMNQGVAWINEKNDPIPKWRELFQIFYAKGYFFLCDYFYFYHLDRHPLPYGFKKTYKSTKAILFLRNIHKNIIL